MAFNLGHQVIAEPCVFCYHHFNLSHTYSIGIWLTKFFWAFGQLTSVSSGCGALDRQTGQLREFFASKDGLWLK